MSDFPTFLPWHLNSAQQWLGQQERFAHAWLLHGLPGIGKREFAKAAAACLLCEQAEQDMACGQCTSCQWIRSGTHPDLRFLRPDAITVAEDPQTESLSESVKKAPSKEIRIEQLRQLHTWFNTATHRGGWRVAVLYPAESMGHVAANALLKVLEEPPAHTVFLMVADAPDRLLPTLVSRCRRLPLAVPAPAVAKQWLMQQGVAQADDWLAACGGAPVIALENSRAHTQAYPQWLLSWLEQRLGGGGADDLYASLENVSPVDWIPAFQRLFTDLQLQAFGQGPRYYPSLAERSGRLARQSRPQALAEALRWLNEQYHIARHPLNNKVFVHHSLDRLALACSANVPSY